MSTQSFANSWADSPRFRGLPRHAGAAVALFGVLVIASWHAHWQPVLQMVPGTAPMQYNTAVCFVLTGAALFLLTTGFARHAPWLVGMSSLIAALTLLEYLGGWDLGIDQILLRPYFEAETAYPGRMSPLSAVCFLLLGAGIMMDASGRKSARRNAVSGALSCMVGVIALVAALGFAFGIEPAYSWGSFSSMAVNTAAVFLVAASGLLCESWRRAARFNANFLRWLPIIGSVTLMIMVTIVSSVIISELESATFWRRHTIQVILRAQAFEENTTDMQRGIRGYVTLDDQGALASYRAGLKLEPQLFNELAALTGDNPVQQRRLKVLAAAMDDLLSYDRRVLALYEQGGGQAVRVSDATGENRKVSGNARNVIRAFSLEEQQLLFVRDASEKGDARSAGRLLIFGSLVAAALLLLANLIVSREMRQRHFVEVEREKLIDELKTALDEVKSLSGMIPICGWCKSVRTDQGYWQTVEQYVREHTDATFTHGICPVCAEKFKAEAASAHVSNPG
jgi:CHASE3 domain sensor protein